MQLAKMFAELGFVIDTSKLSQFEFMITNTKKNMTSFSREVNTANRKLNSLVNHLGRTGTALDSGKLLTAANKLRTGVQGFTRASGKFISTEKHFGIAATKIIGHVNRIDTAITNGSVGWAVYSNSVSLARDRINELAHAIRRLNRLTPPRPPSGGSGGGGGRNGGGSGGGNNGGGYNGNNGPMGGVRSFFKPMLPTGMGMGGLLGGGYAVKEIIQTGREMQAMEQKLKAVSRSTSDFNNNLAFVKKTSNDLAIDVESFGKSYASIFQSAKSSQTTEQIQKTALGLNKYFRALQMTPDEIKGSMKAIGQMYNKQKVMAEELTGQLGERAAGVVQLFAEASGKSVDAFFKDMQKGLIKPEIINKVADLMGQMAEKNGALNQSLQTSSAKQVRFNNKLKTLSLTILKKVDPALAVMFDGLSKIADAIEPIFNVLFEFFSLIAWGVKEIFKGGKALYDLIGPLDTATSKFNTAIVIISAGLISLIAGSTKMGKAVELAFSALKKSIPFVALLTFVWLMRQIQEMYEGEDNFAMAIKNAFIRMFYGIKSVSLDIQIYLMQIELAGYRTWNALKSLDMQALMDAWGNVEMPLWMKVITGQYGSSPLNFAGMAAYSLANRDQKVEVELKPIVLDITWEVDGKTYHATPTVPVNGGAVYVGGRG